MAYWTDAITTTHLWKIELLNQLFNDQWLKKWVIFQVSNTFHYPNGNLQIK